MDGTIEGWGFTGLELVWVAAEVVVAGGSGFGFWGAQVGVIRVGVNHHVAGVESDDGVGMGGCIVEQAQAGF